MRFCCLLLSAALPLSSAAASDQLLSVTGVAGYLSEWQLTAQLSPVPASTEFAGPMSIKHVGLCTHDGPDEIITQLTLRTTKAKPWSATSRSEIKAIFALEGAECALTGSFSDTYRGSMDCTNVKGIPVEISVK
jgi:hypothetical protein